jgi:hypothetical protein
MAIVETAGLAVAAPRIEQYDEFGMSVDDPARGFIFDIQGRRKDPYDREPPFISKATIRMAPQLCEGRYKLVFSFTPVRGHIATYASPARVRGTRLDGAPRRCPFADLPRRGLKSVRVLITLGDRVLMHFSARPSTRAGKTFDRLDVPVLTMYRFTVPGGLVRVQVSARYSAGGSRKIEFLADTQSPR